MELWDAYNENEIKVGIDLVREEKIENGLYHAIVVIIVSHEDGTYLLMQRDLRKSVCPGLWEAGASGCVLKGESFLEAAKRELLEETGILSDNLNLIYTSTNKEFNAFYKVFSCTCNIDKNSIVLQKGETIDFKWLSSKDFIDFIRTDYFANPSKEELINHILSNK
ncbi:MAG: NUDIX hydrolase [Clostridium sp.]